LQDLWIRPSTPASDALHESTGMSFEREKRYTDLLKMPEIKLQQLLDITSDQSVDYTQAVVESHWSVERGIAEIQRASTRHYWSGIAYCRGYPCRNIPVAGAFEKAIDAKAGLMELCCVGALPSA